METKKARKTPVKKQPTKAEKINKVLDLITKGESARASCAKIGFSTSELYRVLKDNEDVRERYARACEERQDKLFNEILEIADTPNMGMVTVVKKDGTEITKADMIQHRRLQIDARKWVLAKMNPKKYGDKVDLTSDGEKLVQINLNLGADEDEDE
jgi:hypothetical protein